MYADKMDVNRKATTQLKVKSWDYSQKYGKGSNIGDIEKPDVQDKIDDSDGEMAKDALSFHYDVDARGNIRVSATAVLTLGIVFALDSISDAAVSDRTFLLRNSDAEKLRG